MEPTNNESNNNSVQEDTEVQLNEPTDTTVEEVVTKPAKHSFGPTVGIVLVVIVLILGALYFFWHEQSTIPQDQLTPTPPVVEIQVTNDPVTAKLESQSKSDKISAIEKDLNTGDYTNLDSDVSNINTELTSSK